MSTFVRVVINTSDLHGVVPCDMIGQALKPFAKFVRDQYLQALADIPNVIVLVSARRKVPHCALGPVEAVEKINIRLDMLKPELFPEMFADEMVEQGMALLDAVKDEDRET